MSLLPDHFPLELVMHIFSFYGPALRKRTLENKLTFPVEVYAPDLEGPLLFHIYEYRTAQDHHWKVEFIFTPGQTLVAWKHDFRYHHYHAISARSNEPDAVASEDHFYITPQQDMPYTPNPAPWRGPQLVV